MFRSLYARLMVLFMAVLLAAMALLSVLLYERIRDDKINTRLDDLLVQARDIAFLAGQGISDSSGEMDRYVVWKCQEIMTKYDAYIVIFDSSGDVIPIGDGTIEFSYDFTPMDTLQLMRSVLNGHEIKFSKSSMENGNPVYNVGVPYVYEGQVLGAVIIHTSQQNVEASYREILIESLRSMLIALALGAVLILVVSQLISRPLRAMAVAADRFAHGDFNVRVRVESKDEIGRLAEAFNRMAEDLDRLEQTRRGFVANVSHELRSPLTSMQGFINGILDGTVPENQREHYLGIVLDETRRLNKLITTLLDLSQMDSGQMVLTKTRFDVNEMIYRVLFRQESRIEEKGMEVNVEFADEKCYVNADADRIEQVLINLIDNAVKYGRENGAISLRTWIDDNAVHVAVSDDGEGIPEEDVPFVFERFYMADKAHTTGKGTGLGLAIVQSIIEQHGHKIEVASVVGEGTTFSFTLDIG